MESKSSVQLCLNVHNELKRIEVVVMLVGLNIPEPLNLRGSRENLFEKEIS